MFGKIALSGSARQIRVIICNLTITFSSSTYLLIQFFHRLNLDDEKFVNQSKKACLY